MINIAELLKDAPKGMKLYSSLFGEVTFVKIDKQSDYPICVTDYKGNGKSFTEFGVYFADHLDAECLLFPSKDRRTWEGWKLPVKPKFKAGDWVVYKYGNCFAGGFMEVQVAKVKDGVYYFASGTTGSFKFIDDRCRLWTIADAKDGDVLVMEETPINHESIFIFQKINEASVIHYCYYFNDNGEEVFGKRISNDIIGHTNQSFHPATKEQRNLLFQKMKEAGYQWDADKKELRNIINPKFKVGDVVKTGNTIDTIAEVDHAARRYYCESGRTISFVNQDLWKLDTKPHYDISNFKPFDKVLVRCSNDEEWMIEFYCKYDTPVHTSPHRDYPFMGIGDSYSQCIPFEGNEHLFGTTDMCDEMYINW